MKKNIKISFGMVLLILVVLFAFQNMESTSISFLFWEFRIPQALMIFVIFVMGMLLGPFLTRR